MRIKINQIKKHYDDLRDPQQVLLDFLGIESAELTEIVILKKSLDARRKNSPCFIYNFLATTAKKTLLNHQNVVPYQEANSNQPEPEIINLDNHPLIIGAGPAGLFTALALVQKGYRPLIFERGENVSQRVEDVSDFLHNRKFSPHSNIAFGEGGAGTFSDGKLTTRSKSNYVKKVLQLLIENGAPDKIRYQAKPHLGTDRLQQIVVKIRKQIEQRGGMFYFNSFIEDFVIKQGEIKAIFTNDHKFDTNSVILAIGNSATDTYETLVDKGVAMAQKPYSVGVRVEHPQKFINGAQYGTKVNMKLLEAAEYVLTHNCKNINRGVYSFCMCPGGKIICASSHPQQLVLNGMSYSTRDLPLANSAIVVTVNEKDFPSNSPLAAIAFRDKIEQHAFSLAPLPYQAPAQRIVDFMDDKPSKANISISYPLNIYNCNINQLFPTQIIEALKEALLQFDRELTGFIKNGIMLAPETRTSAPLRIVRDSETCCSINTTGLYPIGEGSGYAGGIISSAVDALRFVAKVKSLK